LLASDPTVSYTRIEDPDFKKFLKGLQLHHFEEKKFSEHLLNFSFKSTINETKKVGKFFLQSVVHGKDPDPSAHIDCMYVSTVRFSTLKKACHVRTYIHIHLYFA